MTISLNNCVNLKNYLMSTNNQNNFNKIKPK